MRSDILVFAIGNDLVQAGMVVNKKPCGPARKYIVRELKFFQKMTWVSAKGSTTLNEIGTSALVNMSLPECELFFNKMRLDGLTCNDGERAVNNDGIGGCQSAHPCYACTEAKSDFLSRSNNNVCFELI